MAKKRAITNDEVLAIFVQMSGNVTNTAKEAGLSRAYIRKLLAEQKDVISQLDLPDKGKKKEKKMNFSAPVTLPAETDIFKEPTLPGNVSEGVKKIMDVNNTKLELANDALRAKKMIVERIIDMLPLEFNMDNLQKTLKTLHEITKEDMKTDPQQPSSGNRNISYLQIINNNLIQAGYGLKDTDPPDGD